MISNVLRPVSVGMAVVAAGWALMNVLRARASGSVLMRRHAALQKAVIALALMVIVPELLGWFQAGIPAGAVQGLLLVVLIYYIVASNRGD